MKIKVGEVKKLIEQYVACQGLGAWQDGLPDLLKQLQELNNKRLTVEEQTLLLSKKTELAQALETQQQLRSHDQVDRELEQKNAKEIEFLRKDISNLERLHDDKFLTTEQISLLKQAEADSKLFPPRSDLSRHTVPRAELRNDPEFSTFVSEDNTVVVLPDGSKEKMLLSPFNREQYFFEELQRRVRINNGEDLPTIKRQEARKLEQSSQQARARLQKKFTPDNTNVMKDFAHIFQCSKIPMKKKAQALVKFLDGKDERTVDYIKAQLSSPDYEEVSVKFGQLYALRGLTFVGEPTEARAAELQALTRLQHIFHELFVAKPARDSSSTAMDARDSVVERVEPAEQVAAEAAAASVSEPGKNPGTSLSLMSALSANGANGQVLDARNRAPAEVDARLSVNLLARDTQQPIQPPGPTADVEAVAGLVRP